MPDPTVLNQEQKTPPSADPHLASKYIDWLVELINKDKLEVNHSDLKKFDISSMEDHYRIDLQKYDVEVSHSKHPKSGEDIYTMIFNNLSRINENNQSERVILAYIHLTKDQFEGFKEAADEQIHRRFREAEEKRFKEAMGPIDDLLDEIASGKEEKPQEKLEEQKEESSLEAAPLPEPMELPPVPEETPEAIETQTDNTNPYLNTP